MLQVKPITSRFGAELSGVDISKPLSDQDRDASRAAQTEWGVVVFRDTGLDNDGHVAFSRIFGYLEKAPLRPDSSPRYGHRELFDAGNLTPDGSILRDEAMILHKQGDRLWHHDSSFMKLRSSHSLLLCHEAPEHEGPTWFADTRAAWDDLPQEKKDRIADLQCEHSMWWSRRLAGGPYSEEDIDARGLATHPMVLEHPSSGRKVIYVGSHARDVAGMDREEGRALIRELIAWCTQPHYVFPVYYRPGDIVVWDNIAALHRGGDFDHVNKRRDMRRTTVRENYDPSQPADPFLRMFEARITSTTRA